MRNVTRRILRALAGLIGVFLIWEGVWALWRPANYMLPPAHSVVAAMYRSRGLLLEHAWYTTYETVVGFLFAVVVGVAVAAVLHVFPRVARVLWPSIIFSQLTPKVAIAPLLLVWLGFGATTKIVIAFLIAFFAVMANAYDGFRAVGTEVIELGRSMRANRASIFFRFELPHALPEILSGARIAVTFALVGTIVAEFVGSDNGLGYLVMLSNRLLDTNLMFGCVAVLSVLGLVLYAAVGLVEQLLVPWHQSQRVRERDLSRRRAVAGGL
jgi:NitT/TauT family transport system permease protein